MGSSKDHLKTKIAFYNVRDSPPTNSLFIIKYATVFAYKYLFENQATTYISLEDSYELVITVNVTCMMVLASIYLSISDRCPVIKNFFLQI